MVELRGVPAMTQGMGRTWKDSVLTVYLPGTQGLQSPGLYTVPGDLKDVQWRQENSDDKPGHHS